MALERTQFDDSLHHRVLRAPKTDPSLSRRKRKKIHETVDHLNKFSNNGNFMKEMLSNESISSLETHQDHKSDVDGERALLSIETLSVNQLVAKAFRFRMQGKVEEAEKLMEEAERLKAVEDDSSKEHCIRTAARYAFKDSSVRRKNEEDDTDMQLARSIMQNKRYKTSNEADDDDDDDDDEYGDTTSSKKSRKQESSSNIRLVTQQERCLFCFENTKQRNHLVVSIANFTYLMLPQHQPIVPGHCCILTMQHEAASRSVDDNVWDEIRNFKKCLIMMYAKEGKEALFLETVIGLSQQRRHCLIECIPIPREIAKEAPLYFKKAIDEAESEWSQHNAKKLIETSGVKGLRNSIPKNFPYFHVEFGLDKGFVHVIDDEQQFKSNLGLNVIRGMLGLPEEDMYRRRRQASFESQKDAVVSFARKWEQFDWTKQLN